MAIDEVSTVNLVNCLFFNNVAGYGSAIAAVGRPAGGPPARFYYATVNATNCTFYGNRATGPGTTAGKAGLIDSHIGSVTLNSCVLWANSPSQTEFTGSGIPRVNYSILPGGFQGEANISLDPQFTDPANGDFRLKQQSPCIDAGDPSYILWWDDFDLGGKPRLVDGNKDGTAVVDIGAYEFQI